MLRDLFFISLTTAAAIALLLPLRVLLRRRYAAAWLYFVWLLLAVRLLVPFRWEWKTAPVQLPAAVTEGLDIVLSYRPAPAVQQEGTAGSMTVADGLALVWGLGAAGMLCYHFGTYFLFRCRAKRQFVLVEQGTQKGPFVLDPPVYRCAAVEGPVMLGWLRPVILLPQTDYTAEERVAVLLHERCHFRRGDLWYKLLLLLVKSVHWFNPLVWLMVKTAEEDLELACDETVIRRQGRTFKRIYSLAIVKTAGEKL